MGEAVARYEWLVMLVVPLAFAVWQLVSIRRTIARDKQDAERHQRTDGS